MNNESISMEAFLDINGVSNYVSEFFGRLVSFFDKRLAPNSVKKELTKGNVGLVEKNKKLLSTYLVYTPENIDKNFVEYLTTLKTVLDELKTVEKDDLIPLEQWAANFISSEVFAKKTWIFLNKKESNIEKHKTELQKHFNESIGDSIATRPIFTVYGNSEGINKATSLLIDLVDISNSLLDGSITKRADSISVLMRKIATDDKVKERLLAQPEEKIKPVIELIKQASLKLELLSIVLFQVKNAAYSHNESMEKIKKELE